MEMTPGQCRAARGLLNWPQARLAEAANVGAATVAQFERESGGAFPGTMQTLRTALEAAGIRFIDGGATAGPGVQLRNPQRR